MKGPECLRDEELLRRFVAREEELQRAMRELAAGGSYVRPD